jgi:hypothetical protein
MTLSRVLKTRYFDRWMRKLSLTDAVLCRAVLEMRRGLIDAHLGGGIIKKRIPLPGRGKRSGGRTLLATNRDDRWIFLVGFEKNERENIEPEDLRSIQIFAQELLKLNWVEIERRLELGSLLELCHEN